MLPAMSSDLFAPPGRARHLSCPALRLSLQGFTLTELLIVVAIIGILAALTSVGVGKARQSALRGQSIVQMRSVVLAALYYANENKGALPDKNSASDPWPEFRNLGANFVSSQQIDPYLGWKDKAWFDPLTSQKLQRNNYANNPAEYLWRGRLHYNMGLSGGMMSYTFRTRPVRLATIARPSEALLFANLDGGQRGGWPDGYATAGFADGSVKRVKDASYLTNSSAKPSVVQDYLNLQVPGQPSGLRGFDW